MEFERYEDVIDAYERDNMGYATLTDYIKGENIKIKEIEMDPLGDLKQSLKKGGPVGIEVLIMEKMKDGGRVPFRFGGKGYQGGANTGVSRGGGRSAAMGMGGKQRGGTFSAPTPTGGGGPSVGGSTKKVSPIKKIGSGIDKTLSVISPFVDPTSKFGKGLGLYNLLKKGVTTIGNTLFTPAGAAEIDFSKLPGAKDKFTPDFGGILDATSALKSKYKGKTKEDFVNALETGKFGSGSQSMFDRNVDDLFKGVDLDEKGMFSGDVQPTLIGTTDGSFRQTIDIDKEKLDPDALEKLPGGFFPTKKADGGRVGFNVGGITDPQALAIYNSMSAYGFSDKEIADTITAQGYDAGTLGQTNQSQQPQKKIGAPQQNQGIIGVDLQNARDGDSPMITPFKKDPRVGSAFEAYQRSQALKAMGIDDPFADEVTLEGAYYGDMPDVNLQPGSQTFMGKIKSQLGSMVNLSPTLNLFRGLGQGLADLLPVNQRAIAENIAGNMGIRVDDIGRIVNTGDYNDPSNVMAGYNLNKMTDKTFDKRIDNVSGTLSEKYNLGVNEIKGILEGTLSDEQLADINSRAIMKGTNQTTNLIKQLRSLQIAKERNKFIQDAAKAEADRQKKEREAAKLEKQRAKTREADRAAGAFSNVVQLDPGGGGTFRQQTAAKERQGQQVAGPGFGKGAYFARGGIATMFKEKR
jgi:hypothetical protein